MLTTIVIIFLERLCWSVKRPLFILFILVITMCDHNTFLRLERSLALGTAFSRWDEMR